VNLGEARTELGDRGFDYLSPGRMNIMLNRGVVDFEDYWSWPWLRKTATGAAPLTISDLKYVLNVRDATGVTLPSVDPSDIYDTDTAGTPRFWYFDDSSGAGVIAVSPTGSATLTVRYVKESSTLSSDGDTPSIPSRYHLLWIDLAVIRAYQDSDNFAAANALKQDAYAELQELVERYETRDRSGHQQMAELAFNEDD
jgi:hypothetical protein